MSSSLFGVGNIIDANVNGTLVPQAFTATAGQTVFTITNFIYTLGTNSILVFQNGEKLNLPAGYLEVSTTSFELVTPATAGDLIEVIGFPQLNLEAVTAGAVSLASMYTLQNYLNDSTINVKAPPYNAVGDGVADDTVAIRAACAQTGKAVYFPPGVYNTTLSCLPTTGHIYGAGTTLSTINTTQDVNHFLLAGVRVRIHDLGFSTTSSSKTADAIAVGNSVTSGASQKRCDRVDLCDLAATGLGGYLIGVHQGNVGHIANLSATTCKGAILFYSDTPDANTYRIDGFIDANTCVNGVYVTAGASSSDVNASRDHDIRGVHAETCSGIGVYIGTPNNFVRAYTEANTVDWEIGQYAIGNDLAFQADQITVNNCPDKYGNIIQGSNFNAASVRGFLGTTYSGLPAYGIRLNNDDGTAGIAVFRKNGSVNFEMNVSGSGQDQTFTLLNSQAGGPYYLNLNVSGHVYNAADNNKDLGLSTKMWANAWLGRVILKQAAVSADTSSLVIGNTTSTVPGSAGGATALPATPLGYIIGYKGVTKVGIPYYPMP